MSPRSSSRGPGEDQAPDIYVGLLFVSLSALFFGCIFLALQLNQYGWALAQ